MILWIGFSLLNFKILKMSSLIYYVNIKLLKIILKNFRHVNNTFTNHFDLFIPWFCIIFDATRIHINGFLIRIRIRPNDTDPYGSGSETLVRIFLLLPLVDIMPHTYFYTYIYTWYTWSRSRLFIKVAYSRYAPIYGKYCLLRDS